LFQNFSPYRTGASIVRDSNFPSMGSHRTGDTDGPPLSHRCHEVPFVPPLMPFPPLHSPFSNFFSPLMRETFIYQGLTQARLLQTIPPPLSPLSNPFFSLFAAILPEPEKFLGPQGTSRPFQRFPIVHFPGIAVKLCFMSHPPPFSVLNPPSLPVNPPILPHLFLIIRRISIPPLFFFFPRCFDPQGWSIG